MNHQKFRHQAFSIPIYTMDYVFENAMAPKLRRILCQTCRFLTNKFPKQITLDNLELSDLYGFKIINKYSVKASAYNKNFWKSYLRKICLLNKFSYEREPYTQFPYVLQRIEKCFIRELYLSQISIKAKEFNFLTNEGKIEVLNLVLCEIDGLLSIDEIIKRVPNAYHISISPSYISPNTSQNLAKLKQKQKIKVLELFTIDVLIDIGDFWDFLQENLDPKSKITLIYSFYIRAIEFFEVLKQMIQCWEPFDERPLLKC